MARAKGIKEVAYIDERNHAAADRLQPVAWHDCAGGGQVVVERDLADMSKPKFVSGLDWSPPFPWPTHTALRMPFQIDHRGLIYLPDRVRGLHILERM